MNADKSTDGQTDGQTDRFSSTKTETQSYQLRIASRSVCLSVCPQLQVNSNPRKSWSQTASDVDVYTARIDVGHKRKQSGPTFGSNRALRIKLHNPDSPRTQSLVDNRLYQSRYERAEKYFAN